MPALGDSDSLQSPCLSQPIGLREVKGVGGDLEPLPAGVGPLPTLLLQLNHDFSAPLVCIRDQSGMDGGFQTWHGGYLWGHCSSRFGPLAWTILPQTQTTECSTDPSLFTSKGEVPFFLEPSC